MVNQKTVLRKAKWVFMLAVYKLASISGLSFITVSVLEHAAFNHRNQVAI